MKNAKINAKAAFKEFQIKDRISKGAMFLEIQLLDELLCDRKNELSLSGKEDDEMKLNQSTICAKTAFIEEEVNDRISKGAKITEIQLLDEFQNNKDIDLSMINNVDINAVHMPLVEGEDYNIETAEGLETFKKVCELSSKIGDIKGHDIIVVVHTATSLTQMKKFGIDSKVIGVIKDEIEKYSNIQIAIENNVHYNYSTKKGKFYQFDTLYIENNELKLSNVELAKAVNHERCGVCFDTCHAIMSEYYWDYMNQMFEGYMEDVCDGRRLFDIMFAESAQMLKLIHLAYTEKHGYDNYHGLPFTEDSFEFLKHISDLYNNYNAKCPVTIEVYEDDLNNALNYLTTLEQIKKL